MKNHDKNLTKTPWAKMSGAGNCFLITHTPPPQWEEHSVRLCQKHSTQGLVVLKPVTHPDYDFQWVFHNADGSLAEMCGNAACCAVEYVVKKQLTAKAQIKIHTRAGIIQGAFKNNTCSIFSPVPQIKGPLTAHFQEQTFSYYLVQAFVPHAVIPEDINPVPNDLKQLAQWLRHSQAHGVNVSFFTPLGSEKNSTVSKPPTPSVILTACSFERGVEDFTPACGTGALAVAAVYRLNQPVNTVTVQMPGGALKVSFHSRHQASLESPVHWHSLSPDSPHSRGA